MTSVGAPSANSARVNADARAGALLDTFFVTPGVTATGAVSLVQGAEYELVIRGSFVEHVDFGGGTTATYDHDAVYCYGHAPENAPSGAFCAETAPGPYCCTEFFVGLGGQEYRFWTLAGSSGTPFVYASDHVYRTTFTAPASGQLSVTSPYMSTWDTTGQVKVELFGEATGCVQRAAAAEICGPQKVDFSFKIDGFPNSPGPRHFDDDLVDVQARTIRTKLERESEDERWIPEGSIRMTTSYLRLHGFVEKHITLELGPAAAAYAKGDGQRKVVFIAEVERSGDGSCRKGTKVRIEYRTRGSLRFVTMESIGKRDCLADGMAWGRAKVPSGQIGVPVAVTVS